MLLVTLLGIIHDAAKLLGKFRAYVRQFGLWKSAQKSKKVRGEVGTLPTQAQVVDTAHAEDVNVRFLHGCEERNNLFGNRRLVHLLAVHEFLGNLSSLFDLPHGLLHRSLHSMLDNLARLLLDL